MASNVEELTVKYEEEGVVLVNELAKEVLSKGAWATVIFRYQELDRKTNQYGKDKYSIRRYKKRENNFIQQSKFTISSAEQAQKIVEVLQKWIPLSQ
jgi:hypothetical protein